MNIKKTSYHKRLAALIGIFLFTKSSLVFSSPALDSNQSPNQSHQNVIQNQITQALHSGKSLKDLYNSFLRQYGEQSIQALNEISLNEKNSDEIRWAALFGLARLSGKSSLTTISKLMNHQSWMLRDAALKTSAALQATELKAQIEARLKDKALIVRTTAVQTIGHLKLKSSADKLTDALLDPNNFHSQSGQGLWIHKYILDVLTEFKYEAAIPKLVELLQRTIKNRDIKLQPHVISSLEKLTGKNFSDKPLDEQLYLWKRNTVSELTF